MTSTFCEYFHYLAYMGWKTYDGNFKTIKSISMPNVTQIECFVDCFHLFTLVVQLCCESDPPFSFRSTSRSRNFQGLKQVCVVNFVLLGWQQYQSGFSYCMACFILGQGSLYVHITTNPTGLTASSSIIAQNFRPVHTRVYKLWAVNAMLFAFCLTSEKYLQHFVQFHGIVVIIAFKSHVFYTLESTLVKSQFHIDL